MGRVGVIRPTATQIRTNTIVVPKAFINRTRTHLKWFETFQVVVGDRRVGNRKLDMENRIGGLALQGRFHSGDLLRLSIADASLVISKVDEAEVLTLLKTFKHRVPPPSVAVSPSESVR